LLPSVVNETNPKCGVSFLICTRNGERTIVAVLAGLAHSEGDCAREVIIVDNGSADGVSERAKTYWNEIGSPFPIQLLSEPRPGKSYALSTGVAAARFEIIIICDDDNVLAPDYVPTALDIMRDRSIGAVGGAGGLKTDADTPPYFYNFAPWFAVGAQIRNPEDAEMDLLDITQRYPDMALWGAGLVLRRSTLETLFRIRGFPRLAGELKCEDSELCHAVALMGLRLVYTPRLRFEHLISSTRLGPQKICDRFRYDAEAFDVISCYLQIRKNMSESATKTITRFGWRCLRAALTSAPVRPFFFGLMARCHCPWLMTAVERQVYLISCEIRQLARASTAHEPDCSRAVSRSPSPPRSIWIS
jgi:glycosyltransferase involved in cell wall biosynthesis